MRRKDREISRQEACRIVEESPWGTIAMVEPDGAPYCVTVNLAREDEKIYFHCATAGHKLDCLRVHPAVCISCVSEAESLPGKLTMSYRSAILRGTAHEVVDEDEKIHALTLLAEAHDPISLSRLESALRKYLPKTGVWRIDIVDITGKHNPGD